MAKKITAQPVKLRFRDVAGTGAFTEVMGLLKGMSGSQDAPSVTDILMQFYDSPALSIAKGNPFKLSLELIQYDLEELPTLIGGTYDAVGKKYTPAATVPMIFKEFVIDFGTGNAAFVIYNGQVISNINMPDDAALGIQISITALTDATGKSVGIWETAPVVV